MFGRRRGDSSDNAASFIYISVFPDPVTPSSSTAFFSLNASHISPYALSCSPLSTIPGSPRAPEVSLAPGALGLEVFGERLMVFHSHETPARRGRVASLVAERPDGKSYIVLGTRSALFLPHHELGLIMIFHKFAYCLFFSSTSFARFR